MTPLAALLTERIRRFGPITFAEYMRECLYHHAHGYYSQPESRRFADYYTSVDVHPIFGRLLARQFAEMWEQLGRPPAISIGGSCGRNRSAGQSYPRFCANEIAGVLRGARLCSCGTLDCTLCSTETTPAISYSTWALPVQHRNARDRPGGMYFLE